MKKILLAVTAALAITGCSQNEEFDNAAQNAEIKIGTSAVTRAEAMVTKNFKEFRAFGYAYKPEGKYSASIKGTNILDGTFTSTDQTNWTEKDSKKFYWPAEGQVAFFGYSPELTAPNAYSYSEAGGFPTITYTVNNTITDQVDFLVTQKDQQTKETSNGGVSLSFNHALTQVVFKLKGDDENVTYTVTNITFKDLKTTGTYNYETKGWTVSNDASAITSYSIDLSASNVFTGGDANAITLEAKDQLMILMPQEVTDAVVEVTFSATKNGVEIFKSGVKTAKLSGTWLAGEKHVYTLLLKAGDEIKVSGALDDTWTPKDGGSTTVDTEKAK